MKYFTIKELCDSATAKKKGIDNTPSKVVELNLKEFIEGLLDGLREAWGSPIKVTSGYRSPKLNLAINGSKTSAHNRGYAADLVPSNGKMKEFKAFVKYYLKDKIYDQCILESSGGSEWVHIGYKNGSNQQRRQNLIYKNGVYSYIN